MPDPIENGVNPAEPAMPAVADGTPSPGQPEPAAQPEPGTPAPEGEPKPDDRNVPLAALHEERTRRQELQAELDVLKQIAGDHVLFDINGKPVANAMPGQAYPNQPQPAAPNQAAKELEQLWESDPRKAVQVEIMAAMSWRDNQESQVDNQMLQASGKYNDFAQYDGVVRQYIRALPLEQRAKPGIVDLAYYVVKGQNTGNAVERAKAEMLAKIKAGEEVQGLGPGTRPAAPAPIGIQLNEEQLKVADAMGLTPEAYASAMVVKK